MSSEMIVEELYKQKQISRQAFLACKSNRLKTLTDIRDYYMTHKSFTGLRKCGIVLGNELVALISKEPELDVHKLVIDLTAAQRAVMNHYISLITSMLIARHLKTLQEILNEPPTVENLAAHLLSSESLRQHGLAGTEIELYTAKIKKLLKEVSQLTDETQLNSLKESFKLPKTE